MQMLQQECSMGELVRRAIQRGADRVAFISDDQPTTYREFGELLSRFIQALAARGLTRGSAVTCLSSNRMEAYLITAASYVCGIRITQLHPMASADDQAFILGDCGAQALFFDPAGFTERAAELSARVGPQVKVYGLGPNRLAEDILAAAAALPAAPLDVVTEPTDICWLIYTGGTTGRPKGVVHTHSMHMAMTMAELAEWEWPEQVNFLAMTPISHAAGACIMPVLMRSGTFVMASGFSPERFFELVKRHQVTSTFLVPTMIYGLLDYAASHDVDASSLGLVIYGAAPMSPSRMREALARFGPVFMQLYAQSEAPNTVTVLRKSDHDPERFPQRLSSCGMPIYNSQVRLLDDHGREVAVGQTGEICVRGPLVMQGYWNRPDETARALRHGWLYTGDLARQDADGYLYIVGRSKDMIISGGFNVYPAEIEDVLTAHPAVSAAAIIGVPDAKWGEAVKAVVVLRPGQSASPEALIALVRDAKGAVYAPKSVDFVDSLPVTSLGKPDKKALRAVYGTALTPP